jgi:hypothetical protein
MTVVTGLVDAFSYLELSRVFVANMTGNVVFLSFSLGGAPGFIWWASLLAVGAFLVGALLGGLIPHRVGGSPGPPPDRRRGPALSFPRDFPRCSGHPPRTYGRPQLQRSLPRPAGHDARHRHGASERHRPVAEGPGLDDDSSPPDHHRHSGRLPRRGWRRKPPGSTPRLCRSHVRRGGWWGHSWFWPTSDGSRSPSPSFSCSRSPSPQVVTGGHRRRGQFPRPEFAVGNPARWSGYPHRWSTGRRGPRWTHRWHASCGSSR